MYHPTRGGVRGGRDQFKWDDVKADKHRENYLGHSVKAPVGRWQKGKDLFWYSRDKKSGNSDDALKEEIKRVKEEEEQAMREALGLAPKRVKRVEGNRLDKHEYAELVKRGSAADDLGAGHADAAQVQGLGLYKPVRNNEESSPVQVQLEGKRSESPPPIQIEQNVDKKEEREENRERKRNRDERENRRGYKKHDKYEGKREKHENRRERKHGKDKNKKSRHDSD